MHFLVFTRVAIDVSSTVVKNVTKANVIYPVRALKPLANEQNGEVIYQPIMLNE
jgi:hypothetical protein